MTYNHFNVQLYDYAIVCINVGMLSNHFLLKQIWLFPNKITPYWDKIKNLGIS